MIRLVSIVIAILFLSNCTAPDPCSDFINISDVTVVPNYYCNNVGQVELSLDADVGLFGEELRGLWLSYEWTIRDTVYEGRNINGLSGDIEQLELRIFNPGCTLETRIDLDLSNKNRFQGVIGNNVWLDKGTISANCFDNNDVPLEGFLVDLLDPIDSTVIDQQETDETGRYLFQFLQPGDYLIRFNNPSPSMIFLQQNICESYSDSDCNSEGYTEVITISECEINLTIDAGLRNN